MAGNIVKWWKHKILGGYKQFSVQECTTDSEELMYHQVRAPSSCSAPPDLLLVSDRENNIPLKSSVVNIISTSSNAANSGQQKHHHHQQHQSHHQQKDVLSKNSQNARISASSGSSSKNNCNNKLVSLTATGHQNNAAVDAAVSQPHHHHHSHQQQQQHQHHQNQNQNHHHQSSKEERIHLEEFTCDVSVEGGKSSQPLQFSFTFYDLDGHHGKITKDDIVGIVYTIYESIGKSVVVPHCGSKTINVRLTVSPEGKSKAAAAAAAVAAAGSRLKKMHSSNTTTTAGVGVEHSNSAAAAATKSSSSTTNAVAGHSRRQHRYRPRKLIKSDDEDDDSTSEKDVVISSAALKSKTQSSKFNNKIKLGNESGVTPPTTATAGAHETNAGANCCQQQSAAEHASTCVESNCHNNSSHSHPIDNIYENMANLKCCPNGKDVKKCDTNGGEECRAGCCSVSLAATQQKSSELLYQKQTSARVKMLRKARKQKYLDHCYESRQRSLSVGNESRWKNRTAAVKNSPHILQESNSVSSPQTNSHDVVDGATVTATLLDSKNTQLTTPTTSAGVNNASSSECWKTALNRNDLIGIIRESMEKNRLCFQLNGKPQANVSPIRHHHRQRSNTVSKIPTPIANSSHNNNNNSNSITKNSSTDLGINNITTTPHPHHHQQQQQQQLHQDNTNYQQQQQHHHHHQHNNSSSNSNHPQPHIPIYHQQMAINPAVLAAQNGIIHSKINLCGYDSFLHATICGGGTSHSPPPPLPNNINNISTITATTPPHQNPNHQQQPIATVQPIMTAVSNAAIVVPNIISSTVNTPKIYGNSSSNQVKTSKILRSGAAATTAGFSGGYHSQQSSPQFHGYQRLSSSSNGGSSSSAVAAAAAAAAAAGGSATKVNVAQVNSINPNVYKSQFDHLEKWLNEREQQHCASSSTGVKASNLKMLRPAGGHDIKSKKDVKNYDNLLFAKLTEKLQESPMMMCNSKYSNKENIRRMHHNSHNLQMRMHRRSGNSGHSSSSGGGGSSSSNNNQKPLNVNGASHNSSKYVTLIPINGDPLECQNLLGNQTSDEESMSSVQQRTTSDVATVNSDTRQVAQQNGGLSIAADDGERSSSANNSSSSSLIHRYVHEHIHHHYHHFEEKDE